MPSAKRKSDGQTVTAYFESKASAPFACLERSEEVVLKTGRRKVNHFAHVNPIACKFAVGESDMHRACKMEIYEALLREPGVRGPALERPLGSVRPDVSAYFNGLPVAIEVQISSLSIDTIIWSRPGDYRQALKGSPFEQMKPNGSYRREVQRDTFIERNVTKVELLQ